MTATDLARRADGWLFGPEPGVRLRFVGTALAVLVGLRVGLGPYRGLAGQPQALFRPPPFLTWLPEMPSVEVIVAIQVVGVAAALLAVLGWRYRATFLIAWGSLLVLGGLRASRGKVQHNDVLLLLVCVAFLLAPVNARWQDRVPSRRFGWPIRTGIFVVASSYFFTGLAKLISSGPAWITSDNMRFILYRAADDPRAPTDAVSLFIADRPWLATLCAAGTIVLEIGFLSVLFWPGIRPWFVLASLALHTSIYLTHGLDYWNYVAVTAIVLIDWPAVHRRVVGISPRSESSSGGVP